MAEPTYKDLINMLGEAEEDGSSTAEALAAIFCEEYPHISIGRPARLLETVRRIDGPIRNGRLKGSARSLYLQRTWTPRIRNLAPKSPDTVPFPDELNKYGLSLEILSDLFASDNTWSLHGTPNVEFYRLLHRFLKVWSVTRHLTKTAIGKLYLAIDQRLQERRSSPYNTYRFIEQLAFSSTPDSAPMSYGLDKQLGHLQTEIDNLNTVVKEQQDEISQLSRNLEKAQEDLSGVKQSLKAMAAEKQSLQQHLVASEKRLNKTVDVYESTLTDLFHVEDDLLEENSKLSTKIASLEPKSYTSFSATSSSMVVNFVSQTKSDKHYSDSIRQLYYSLLADQIPPAKIESTIRAVLKCFVPSLDHQNLKLPREKCAGYMRREELKTVSMAHKACVATKFEEVNLNSDGTTKFQRKIGGVAMNNMVMCLNEVPDGTADSMIEDISRELAKLRDIARNLKLSHPERINWTLFVSSTSDSASSQKRFNRLLQERLDEDKEKFGPCCSDAIELVQNLCAMHLGSNLRKAFLEGTKTVLKDDKVCAESSARSHDSTDTLIHEFCKLFGTHGTPEYGCGVSFKDFLDLKIKDYELCEYYHACKGVTLERQVGSRYFVSAANAAKIFFLTILAMEFLEYTGKNEGNKLEQSVYRKIKDSQELACLKADALMFYFVYADLVMLAKSETLSKSALDMNQHYVELQLFLLQIRDDPKLVTSKDHRVFVSDSRLYGLDKAINHRIRSKNEHVYSRLFKPDKWDSSILYPLVSAGAASMEEKLRNYAKNQLPGGIYWAPEPPIADVLRSLKPNNDICESILGLNDYLTSAIPNMHQMTRSNLVEIKKNKTVKWYEGLEQEERSKVTKLAIKRRDMVMKEYKEESRLRSERKQEIMRLNHQRRKAREEKLKQEKSRLSEQHLICSEEDLLTQLQEIDASTANASSRRKKKLALIRVQINIRKKVHHQNVQVPFTKHGKTRPLTTIITEFSRFITENPCSAEAFELPDDPFSLIGKQFRHKFVLECGGEEWFNGVIASYNARNRTHELVYDDEEEHQHFDITEDIVNGDLKFIL